MVNLVAVVAEDSGVVGTVGALAAVDLGAAEVEVPV